ncbi:hypothetical protein [Dongia sp.]|uniref:hypothetical protein n=1 Tax=Dongia sp. TaxID=1977262 RepID=UPI0035B12DF8
MPVVETEPGQRFEILPGFPTTGPLPQAIGNGESWGGHSEGFVVRFYPSSGAPWVGNFKPWASGAYLWHGVAEHPDGQHLIVVARGMAYLVDPENPESAKYVDANIQHVISLPELGAVLISDGLSFTAIRKDGVWWESDRISWDEFRNIRIENETLHGDASSPDETWWPFSLDLLTGRSEGGSFAGPTYRRGRTSASGDQGANS